MQEKQEELLKQLRITKAETLTALYLMPDAESYSKRNQGDMKSMITDLNTYWMGIAGYASWDYKIFDAFGRCW